jgi:IclR family transcriptional regulator, KDG regulon repressor
MTSEIAPKIPLAARAPGDKTLTKGLQLLEALSQCEGPRGISELAHQLSLTKSNVHRLLQTLSRCGYVTQEASTERYLLSAKLWQVSRRTKPFDALQGLARPILRHIVEQTNESVIFAIVEQDDLIVIDQVETSNPIRVVFFSVGQSVPVDRVIMMGKGLTALQLTALAARPEAEARTVLRKLQEQLKKGKTFVDAQLSHISATRKSGFAVNRGEWVTGATAVAVPVLGHARNLTGILSCFGPGDRFTEASVGKVRKILSLGADDLSLQLHKS